MTKRLTATLRLRLWGASALAFGLLSGCSQFQPYQRADIALPSHWATANTEATRIATEPAAAPLPWRSFVNHAPLQTLIEQALEHNLDARIAQRQMAQLQAQWQQRRAAQGPTLAAAADGQRTGGDSATGNLYRAGLLVSNWEIDFFGRLESLSEAARAQYLASAEAERWVRVSLVSGVVSAWLEVQSAHALLEVSQRTLANHEASLRLVQLRLQHGTASALQRQHSEALVQAARVAQARQQRQLQLALHQLQQLVGPLHDPAASTPAPLPNDTSDSQTLALLQPVAVGLPSEVLLQRPDVRAAEQRLAAAQAQIGAARAAFFPRIALTAQLGSASTELAGLFAGGSWGWTLAPQALLPLFDYGANRAGLAAAQAERDIALLQYEQAIQSAFKEVRDALASQSLMQAEHAAQQALWQAESQRAHLSARLLALGSASQLELLDAQRSAFAAEQQLVQLRFALLQNRVALYRATGGH
ncbi:MAG: efflux transporter outer membrane subunit [Pseudomonadota bacterium]|jgi:NodT family efflux transporter outer membrane factor (OMF) lipoprotein